MVGGTITTKSKPEIIEIPKSNSFPNLPHLPIRHSGSNTIGLTDNGQIIICAITTKTMMGCFALFMNDGPSFVWNQANFNMITKRSYAASAKMDNKEKNSWLITGGEKHDSDGGSVITLDSTEIFSNSTFSPGPKMLLAVSMHCMLKLNNTHILKTGGKDNSSKALNDVNFLDLDLIWEKLPNMNIGRYGHACGHYTKKEIVVAGGLNIISTEIYSIKFSEW